MPTRAIKYGWSRGRLGVCIGAAGAVGLLHAPAASADKLVADSLADFDDFQYHPDTDGTGTWSYFTNPPLAVEAWNPIGGCWGGDGLFNCRIGPVLLQPGQSCTAARNQSIRSWTSGVAGTIRMRGWFVSANPAGTGDIEFSIVRGGFVQSYVLSPGAWVAFNDVEVTIAPTLSVGFGVKPACSGVSNIVGRMYVQIELVEEGGLDCYADFDLSDELDVLDFIAFQQAFLAGSPLADANADGVLNLLDLVEFQQQFVECS